MQLDRLYVYFICVTQHEKSVCLLVGTDAKNNFEVRHCFCLYHTKHESGMRAETMHFNFSDSTLPSLQNTSKYQAQRLVIFIHKKMEEEEDSTLGEPRPYGVQEFDDFSNFIDEQVPAKGILFYVIAKLMLGVTWSVYSTMGCMRTNATEQ